LRAGIGGDGASIPGDPAGWARVEYEFQWYVITRNWPLLLKGAWLTVQLSLSATALGLCVGIVGALLMTTRARPLEWLVLSYVEVVRNTPFLVQLFFIFFGLSEVGITLAARQAALIALTFNLGAYATEIVRAGVESIHRGQVEAGISLGLSHLQVFRYVILKPALAKMYPALASQFVLLMLNSSVVSVIAVDELTHAANYLESRTFRSFEIYFTVTVMYLALALIFRALFHTVHRFSFARR
jgi:polar amino acid transport system permease protein